MARVAESPDGMIVLVGRTARDNDVLSLKLAAPRDFWFHVAGESGSHVVVRNPDTLDALAEIHHKIPGCQYQWFNALESIPDPIQGCTKSGL